MAKLSTRPREEIQTFYPHYCVNCHNDWFALIPYMPCPRCGSTNIKSCFDERKNAMDHQQEIDRLKEIIASNIKAYDAKPRRRWIWILVGVILIFSIQWWWPFTPRDIPNGLRAIHTKAFPAVVDPNAIDPNEIAEIRKQLVWTVKDMRLLFNNDQLIKKEADELKKQFEEMHPVMDPNEETK